MKKTAIRILSVLFVPFQMIGIGMLFIIDYLSFQITYKGRIEEYDVAMAILAGLVFWVIVAVIFGIILLIRWIL